MLYPLSYEGARAQSSDLVVHLKWQGSPTFIHVTRTRVRTARDHSSSPRTPFATTIGCGGPRQRRLTRAGIR